MLVVLTEYKVPRELGTLNYIYIFFNWNLGERQQCNTQTQRKLFCVIVQECFDYFADYTTKKIDSTKNRSSHNRSKKSIILAVWIDYCQNRLKIGNTTRGFVLPVNIHERYIWSRLLLQACLLSSWCVRPLPAARHRS
jgi:hypothetical protein